MQVTNCMQKDNRHEAFKPHVDFYMKAFAFLLLMAVMVSCSRNNQNLKFTPEQIALLSLDSTQDIKVIADSFKAFDLNPLLGKRSFNFGEMIKSIKFVPLETNKKSLIAEIEQIIVSDSNIYISSSDRVLIFDNEGKYISLIQRGQGPGEILQLKGIAYDNIKSELIVYNNKFLSFYNKDGDFIRRESVPLNARCFTIIPEGYIFQTMNGVDNRHLGYSKNYQILVTDKVFQLKSKGFPYRFAENNDYGSEYVGTNPDFINLRFNFVDTIYQYVDNQRVDAKYFFDISKKKIPEKMLASSSYDFWSITKQSDYYYFTGHFEETNSHIFVAHWNRFIGTRSNFFIDKRTNNIEGGTSLQWRSGTFPGLSTPIAANGRYFIGALQPFDIIPRLEVLDNPMISDEDVAMLKQLKEDDNQVLIFYELKEF